MNPITRWRHWRRERQDAAERKRAWQQTLCDLEEGRLESVTTVPAFKLAPGEQVELECQALKAGGRAETRTIEVTCDEQGVATLHFPDPTE